MDGLRARGRRRAENGDFLFNIKNTSPSTQLYTCPQYYRVKRIDGIKKQK